MVLAATVVFGQIEQQIHEALRGVGRELMRNHLRHCAAAAFKAGGEQADAASEELIELMYRNAR